MRIDATTGAIPSFDALRSSATVRRLPSFETVLAEVQTAQQTDRYTVQRGDTLSHIVQRSLRASGSLGSTADIYRAVDTVVQENGLENPDLILPGQSIDLRSLMNRLNPLVEISELPPAEAIPTDTTENRPRSGQSAEGTAIQESQAAPLIPAPPLARSNVLGIPGGEASTQLATVPLTGSVQPVHDGFDTTEPPAASMAVDSSVQPAIRTETAIERTPIASPWRQILGGRARLTSEFGVRPDPWTGDRARHEGIDLAAARGTAIYPLRAGEVIASEFSDSYGNVIVVRHDDGTETVYGHNAANRVSAGDRVTEDTLIGTVGSSGRSTAPHLHFEVRVDGEQVDPVPYLSQEHSSRHGMSAGS